MERGEGRGYGWNGRLGRDEDGTRRRAKRREERGRENIGEWRVGVWGD